MDNRKLKLIFFAQLRDVLGESVIISVNSTKAGDLKSELMKHFADIQLLQKTKLASSSKILLDNDDITLLNEIYLIPPTSGG